MQEGPSGHVYEEYGGTELAKRREEEKADQARAKVAQAKLICFDSAERARTEAFGEGGYFTYPGDPKEKRRQEQRAKIDADLERWLKNAETSNK